MASPLPGRAATGHQRRLLAAALCAGLGTASCRAPSPATPCASDEGCPPGYTCLEDAKVCARNVAPELPAPACGSVRAMQDDFAEDAYPCQQWGWPWRDSSVEVSADGEALRIDIPQGAADSYAGCTSVYHADLHGASFALEVVEPPDPNQPLSAHFGVAQGEDVWLGFHLQAGTLWLEAEVGDSGGQAAIDHDPDQHRWLRLREQAGELVYEAAAQLPDWTVLRRLPAPAFGSALKLVLSIGAWDTTSAPSAVLVDNLNLDGELLEPWCPLGTLRDAFDRTELGPGWLIEERDGCAYELVDEQLRLSVPGQSSYRCSVQAPPAFVLDQAGIAVEIPGGPVIGAMVGLVLWDTGGVDLGLAFLGDEVTGWISAEHAPELDDSFGAPAESHRWLRLRHADEELLFEARPDDSASWQLLYTSALPRTMDTVGLWLMLGRRAGDPGTPPTGTVEARFDNVNLP